MFRRLRASASGPNLALGVASEADRLDDRPDVGCRGDVKIRGLLVSECTFEKLRGVTSKAGLYIPAREIGEQLLAITDTAQARDREDNADRIAIRFEHIAVSRHVWRHGPCSQAPEPRFPIASGSRKARQQIDDGINVCIRKLAGSLASLSLTKDLR